MSLGRAWLVGAALVVIALVVERLGYWVPLPPTRVRGFGVTQTVQVERVSDGDTVVLSDGRRVDLEGIAAPEDQELGSPIAHAALAYWIKQAHKIEFRVCPEQTAGRHGRTRGHLSLDGVDVQEALVAHGLARAVAQGPCGRAQADRLAQLQMRAAEGGFGLWALAPRLAACDTGNWDGRWVEMEGEVQALRLKDNELRINWRGDAKRCISVAVSGRVLWADGENGNSEFVEWADSDSPKYLVGRHVRVRGKPERVGKRREMRLSHSSELTYN